MAKRAILEEDNDIEPIEARKETRGRPTKYNAQLFPKQARLLAARGATQEEIAEVLGVATSTLKVWLARYSELSDAVQAGNDMFDPRVERALAESAIGYWVTWEEEEFVNGKLVTVTRKKEYFSPDVRAQKFWLKNRMKDKWSDVHKQEVKAPQYKSSAELIEEMRKQVIDLQSEGYLEGVIVHPRPLQRAGRQK